MPVNTDDPIPAPPMDALAQAGRRAGGAMFEIGPVLVCWFVGFERMFEKDACRPVGTSVAAWFFGITTLFSPPEGTDVRGGEARRWRKIRAGSILVCWFLGFEADVRKSCVPPH